MKGWSHIHCVAPFIVLCSIQAPSYCGSAVRLWHLIKTLYSGTQHAYRCYRPIGTLGAPGFTLCAMNHVKTGLKVTQEVTITIDTPTPTLIQSSVQIYRNQPHKYVHVLSK